MHDIEDRPMVSRTPSPSPMVRNYRIPEATLFPPGASIRVTTELREAILSTRRFHRDMRRLLIGEEDIGTDFIRPIIREHNEALISAGALIATNTAALGAASRHRVPTEVRWKHRSGLQSFVWHVFATTKKGSVVAFSIRQDSASEQLLAVAEVSPTTGRRQQTYREGIEEKFCDHESHWVLYMHVCVGALSRSFTLLICVFGNALKKHQCQQCSSLNTALRAGRVQVNTMSSQHPTPRSSPRSNYSATIRLICQESGGEIEPENLHVTVQGCMSDSLEEVEFKATEIGEILAQEHQL
eukprot:1634897-Amphidinium_carterae.1